MAGLLLAAGLALQASPSPAPPEAALDVPEPAAGFGEVYAGAVVTHRFAVRNRGPRPLRIVEARATSGGARVTAEPQVLAPGGEGHVDVQQPTAGGTGVAEFRYFVRADDGAPERELRLTGFVQSAYDPDQPAVDFGTAAPGAEATLELFSREVARLEVREIAGAPAFLSAQAEGRAGAAGEGVALRLRLAPDVPLGFHAGALRVRTNVERQPEVTVGWRAGVYDDLAPSEAPIDIGVVREGQPMVKVVQLVRRSGGLVEMDRIDTGGTALKAELVPCPRASDSCRGLRLSGTAPAAGTPLAGTITLVPKGSRPVTLPYSGTVVPTDAGPATLRPRAEKRLPIPPKAPPPPEVGSASAPLVGRPGERWARITWKATQEKDTYGYLVYRAERPEGPFRRVNAEIVRVAPGEGPHSYAFADDQVAPGHTYYYYLESVDRTGKKSRLSAVMAKVIPPAP